MDKEVLLERFKVWALNVILLCRELPKEDEFIIIKRQLIKSATSSAANYSASNRGKSTKDLITKGRS